MADVPDERIVAGLRHLVGDLRGSEKFTERGMRAKCLVCNLCYGCHMNWTCPSPSDWNSMSKRDECYRSCNRKPTGEDAS